MYDARRREEGAEKGDVKVTIKHQSEVFSGPYVRAIAVRYLRWRSKASSKVSGRSSATC
jgi:hypothetical protein